MNADGCGFKSDVEFCPVAIHDWGANGARWTVHPSLTDELERIVNVVSLHLRSREPNLRFTEPFGDSIIFGLKSADPQCPDQRAARRGAFKFKVAVVARDLLAKAGLAPKTFGDCVFDQLKDLEAGIQPGSGQHLRISFNIGVAYQVSAGSSPSDSRFCNSTVVGANFQAFRGGASQACTLNNDSRSVEIYIVGNHAPGWVSTESLPEIREIASRSERSNHTATIFCRLKTNIVFPLFNYLVVAVIVVLFQAALRYLGFWM